MKIKKAIKELISIPDDKKWEFLIANKDLGFVVNLDNDETFITHPDSGTVVYFQEHIGYSFGLFELLDAIGIKYQGV